jgi:hypothetical protein
VWKVQQLFVKLAEKRDMKKENTMAGKWGAKKERKYPAADLE